MADGSIEIDVELNADNAKSQADRIGGELGQRIDSAVQSAASNTGSKLAQSVSEVGKGVESMGKSYTKGVTLPIAAAAAAVGASAVKIDTALTGVRKTVDGTEEQYEALKDAAIEFSKTNAVDPAQILEIQALGAQLGYGIEELDMFGEVVSGLGIATNMEAEEAATELAQFANIMGMSHDDTKRYGSTIVELGNNFATTEADISHMAMRIAGAGKQIGLSEADVLGLATALSSMGIEAEAGGTAISTIMSSIDKDVALGTDSLATWAETANMSVEDFSRAWKEDATGALSAVLIGMDAATQEGGNMAVMLDELGINSIRQTDTLKRLASNSEFLGGAIQTANDAWEENIALDKEVENRNKSMASQLEIFKNRVTAAATEVGEPLMESLIGIIDAAQPLVDALASGAKAFADMDEDGQRVVLMAVAAAAAFGPLTTVTGKLMASVSTNKWAVFSEQLAAIKAGASEATAKMNAQAKAMGSYRTIMVNGQKVMVRYNAATKQATVLNTAFTSTTRAQAAAMKVNEASIKAYTVASSLARTATRALASAFVSIAPIAAFTVIAGAVTAVAQNMGSAKERSEGFQQATVGLEQSAMGATNALDDESGAAGNLGDSIAKVDVGKFISDHAELAKTIRDNNTETQASASLLKDYGETIGSALGHNAELTEAEVADLELAVKNLNSAAGTNYEVIQDGSGAYQVMADGAVVAADAIQRVIDAQIRQSQIEALTENYEQLYSQLNSDSTALAEKQAEINALEQERAELAAGMQELSPDMYASGEAAQYAAQLEQLDEKIATARYEQEQMNASMGATQSAANRTAEQMNLLQQATGEGASEMVRMVADNIQMQSAIQSTGYSLTDVVAAMESAGMSAAELASIMETQGISGVQGYVNGLMSGASGAQAAGQNLGDAAAQGAGSATGFGESGEAGGGQYAEGWERGAGEAEGAAKHAGEQAVGALEEGTQGAGATGQQAAAGVARGLASGTGAVTAAARALGRSLLAAMKSELEIHSPSKKAETVIGRNFALGVSNGIKRNAGNAALSASDLADKILKSAEKRLSNKKRIQDVSLAYEVGYWKAIMGQVKKGTAAYHEARLNYLEARKKSNQELMDAEAKFKKSVKSTQQQLSRDLKAAAEQRTKDIKAVREKLADELQKLDDEYLNSVESRRSEILGAFDVFDRFTRNMNTTSAEYLLENMREQAAAAEEYSQAMVKLKSRIGEGSLYEEIAGKGVDALRDIRGLNSMTDEELREFTKLYEQRNAQAQAQAKRDNEALLKEIQQEKAQLQEEARKEIASINAEYKKEVKSLRTQAAKDIKAAGKELSTATKNLGTAASDAVSKMAKNIKVSASNITKSVNSAIKSINKLNKLGTAAKKSTSAKSAGKGKAREAAVPASLSAEPVVATFGTRAAPQQVQSAIGSGVSAVSYYNTAPAVNKSETSNQQTVIFQGDVSDPDVVVRKLRMQQLYELAGDD